VPGGVFETPRPCGLRILTPVYDRVLIAWHSLGSVIAYDTMNSLLNLAWTSDPGNLDGNPRTRAICADRLPWISTQQDLLFLSRTGGPETCSSTPNSRSTSRFSHESAVKNQPAYSRVRTNPVPRLKYAEDALANGFKWINAYSLQDPISGKLGFYVKYQQ